ESHISIGKLQFKTGNLQAATREAEKGLALAEKSGEQDLMLLGYKSLSEIYAASKNYHLAYKNHIRYKEVTDSLFNTEKNQKFVQLKLQREFKEERDSIKNVQIQKDLIAKAAINDQRIIRNFIIIV